MAPREELEGRKEQPLHTGSAPPPPEWPNNRRSSSPLRKGEALPGQTPRAPLATALAPATPLRWARGARAPGARAPGARLPGRSRSRGTQWKPKASEGGARET